MTETTTAMPAPRRMSRAWRGWVGGLLAVALAAGIPAPVAAGSRSTWPGGPYTGLEARLQGIVADARSNGVPGVSAAIETADGLWTGVAGKASMRPDRSVTPETAFEAASVTKTFVAAVVLLLVEDGRLSLSWKLSRWMPEFPYASSITVRHLLSHTSGIRDLFDDPANQRYVQRHKGHRFTFREIVRRIGRPRARPGTRYDYSNANYILLGRIVERVTGKGIATVIRSRLLGPLDLDHTWFQGEEPAPSGMATRRAVGYARSGGGWDAYGNGTGLRPWTSMATFVWAAGAMMSTPSDLARWARALYGGRVLSATSLERMTEFTRKDYGLGARRAIKGDREAWGHGGSLDGFQTGMWYLPAIDASVVIMWNRWPHDTTRVTDRLAEPLVDRLDPDVTPPEARAPRIAIRSGAQVSASSVRLAVTWPSAIEDKGRVVRYELERSLAGGPWEDVRLEKPLTWGVDHRVRPGQAVRFRVRATNDEGLRSAWAVGPVVRPELVDESALPDDAWDGAWSSVAAEGALMGRVRRSTDQGASVTFETDQVLAMAVVMSRAPTRGRVAVGWDASSTTTIDLGMAPKVTRWVAIGTRWGNPGTRRMTVTLRTGGADISEVDGFVVLRDAG